MSLFRHIFSYPQMQHQALKYKIESITDVQGKHTETAMPVTSYYQLKSKTYFEKLLIV